MPITLYEGDNLLLTLPLVTFGMGGLAAYMSGRAIAQTWRPFWHVPLYMLALAAAVRFCHFALFEEPLLSLPSYIVDFVSAFVTAALGYQTLRVRQMLTQYGWLFRPSGPLGWRRLP
jgi:predicted MFS family arabinose efflux permease